jgi:16S rRNA (guanine966-N2)-methyltransferase
MTTPRRNANRVRIIGGEWRSRLVKFPPTMSLRPTPDRVRETLFNWLGQRLDGLKCLDLFAGSGALGFEALSRGAALVVMVERDRATAAALRDNARELDAKGIEIVQAEALAFIANDKETYDVVFLDPPYASNLAQRALDEVGPRLAPGARVYVETAATLRPGSRWRVLREDRAGQVRYALFEPATP